MRRLVLIFMLFCLLSCFSGCAEEREAEKGDSSSGKTSSVSESESASKHKEFRIVDSEGNTIITQEQLEAAEEYFDDAVNSYNVHLTFTAEGAAAFADATSRNIGETLDIYVDDILIAQPTVNAPITDGEALVLVDSAEDMAAICKIIRETIE